MSIAIKFNLVLLTYELLLSFFLSLKKIIFKISIIFYKFFFVYKYLTLCRTKHGRSELIFRSNYHWIDYDWISKRFQLILTMKKYNWSLVGQSVNLIKHLIFFKKNISLGFLKSTPTKPLLISGRPPLIWSINLTLISINRQW